MKSSSYKKFISDCKKIISEENNSYVSDNNVNELFSEVFRSIEKTKLLASNIRYKFINSIDDSLIAFDKNFSANGGNIHWCIAYDDFLSKFDKILENQNIKKVNIFSSSFTKELGIEQHLKTKEIKNDLQTSDCVVFTPQFGIVNTGSLFFNFTSAYEMELVLNAKLKIFVIPINDFIFKSEEVEIFSHLYSIYKNNIDYPYLTSVFTPSPLCKESDVHLFLIDNGRSNILENENIRKALCCINCGACKSVCPVFNIIGEEPYDNIFSGPIANVILPFIENVENYKHLPFSCADCGNCTTVCPVNIPISELIIENKRYFFENKLMDMSDVQFSKSMYRTYMSRKKMNRSPWIKNFRKKLFSNSNNGNGYKFSKSTFNQQYIDKKYGTDK